MFQKTNEIKVLRDPIHDYIHISYQVIWDCLNARAFQRLHRIHQLGGVFQVYHTAEHSRFAHSLGVYEIVRRMVEEIRDLSDSLDEFEKVQVMCAALLHDLGHGPYSHFFESLQSISHEQRTALLILDEKSEVHQALVKAHPELPQKVVVILQHTHPKKMLSQMISSQLDADRMDYLLRDAYETGTSYGTFDLERILRTMRVKEETLCMKESGMHSVEDFIMARYHMYWQVYLHPDAKSYELLIQLFFKQYEKSATTIPLLDCLTRDCTNEEFLLMDEARLLTGFQEACTCDDPLLKEYARCILDRHLLEWKENPTAQEEQEIKAKLEKAGYDLEAWYVEEKTKNNAYLPYTEEDSIIWILDKNQQLQCLSSKSEIVKALLRMENQLEKRIYYRKNL